MIRSARYIDDVLRWVGCSLLAFGLVAVDVRASAQDDWGLTRPRTSGATRPARPARPRTGRPRTGRPTRPRRPPTTAPAEGATPPEGGDRDEVLIQRYLGVLERDPQASFAFTRLIELHRQRDGNVDALVSTLRERIAADDAAYAPRMILGHVLEAQGQVELARAEYLRAAELRPREAAPPMALARIDQRASRLPEARARYDEALERTRERLAREELLREVAGVALEQRDFDGARAYFDELAGGTGGSIYLRTEFGRALAAAREWERAVQEYERVLRALRGDNRVLPPVLLELSRAQLETGEVEASIETLDRALRTAGGQAGIRAEIYEQMRTAYRRTDRLPELAERLRREAGGGYEASFLLGQIEDELGNDEAALTAYRRAIQSRPRDIDARRSVIQILMRSGELEEVVAEYRALIRAAPREPRFVIELAQHLMQTDQRDEALRLIRDTGRRNPRDASLHDQLAQLYARWGEDELANREVELLARIDPHDPAHLIALGSQQLAAGNREAALATWRRVLEVESDRAAGHATFAGILADHDLLPEAVEEYRHAVELEGDEIAYVRGLAVALERSHLDGPAEAQWHRVLELAGDDRIARREARERVVAIWSRTRQITTRIHELEGRFAADPPDVEAGRFLAEAFRRRGPPFQVESERVLSRIVEAEPSDVESLLALERLRRHRGDLAGAIEVLARLRDADPRRASTYLSQMAEHALALYRDDEAVRYAAEAVERNPDDASAHRRLADLYRQRQDGDHAVQSYRRALELNDRLYPVYFELAELHLARGETEAADLLYRQVLRITPDDDLVARAARASIQLNLGAGTLGSLERDLLPLSLGHPERPIFRRMAVELYDAYAAPLARQARRGGRGAAEADAELRRLGARAIKPLLEALADPDPSQRHVALDILGDLGNASAAAPLLAVAENRLIDLRERMQALRAAGEVAQPALVPRFTSLAEGPDARLRAIAAWGLARIGGRDARRASERLRTATDPAVRAYAFMGLALDPSRGTADELARALDTEGHEDVIFALTWALGRAGSEAHAARLVEVLRSRGGAAAVVAAGALGSVGGPDAVDALVEALFDPDPVLRGAAAAALRRLQSTEPEPPDGLPPPDAFERVRDYVARLSGRGEPPPIDDLAPLAAPLEAAARVALSGPVEGVLAALSVLDGGGQRLALGPLTADLDAWPADARDRARTALDALGEALMDELVAAASHEDAAVRVAALRILVRHPRADADAAVAAALSQPPVSVQRAALDALRDGGHVPGDALSEQLADMVRRHRDWSMRTRAASALAATRSETARAALREALEDDSYAFVREAAADALATNRGPSDVAALERARDHDPEARVRDAATRALR
ncbi:MAG: HEAT repeat domain-containing protein [Sandaracinaceae bacterium]|nr:HEAT repeat domain-containing protein [Sandaracinaceae bacterium]